MKQELARTITERLARLTERNPDAVRSVGVIRQDLLLRYARFSRGEITREQLTAGLVEHAETELQRLGGDKMQRLINKCIIALVRTFAKQGHSGFSAMYVLDLFNKLARFQNLTPITNNPKEWRDVSGYGSPDHKPLWQNLRNSSYFSNDGGKTWWCIDENGNRAGKDKPENPSAETAAVQTARERVTAAARRRLDNAQSRRFMQYLVQLDNDFIADLGANFHFLESPVKSMFTHQDVYEELERNYQVEDMASELMNDKFRAVAFMFAASIKSVLDKPGMMKDVSRLNPQMKVTLNATKAAYKESFLQFLKFVETL